MYVRVYRRLENISQVINARMLFPMVICARILLLWVAVLIGLVGSSAASSLGALRGPPRAVSPAPQRRGLTGPASRPLRESSTYPRVKIWDMHLARVLLAELQSCVAYVRRGRTAADMASRLVDVSLVHWRPLAVLFAGPLKRFSWGLWK